MFFNENTFSKLVNKQTHLLRRSVYISREYTFTHRAILICLGRRSEPEKRGVVGSASFSFSFESS